jgi:hypothetical protein
VACEEAAPAAATSDDGGWCDRVGCVATDLHAFGVRVVAGGWIWSAAGGAVGVEGACGWWLPAPAVELGAALERRSAESCPVALCQVQQLAGRKLAG